MIAIDSKASCSGCYACASICTRSCIEMIMDEEGFWYPKIDTVSCSNCELCEKVCPIIHKWKPDDNHSTIAYAAINKNEEIRLQSSSGGIFTLLAAEIIKQDGVVFGASFSDDFKAVKHIYIDNIEDLDKLRGSKYVQSEIGYTYKQAKKFLDNGRKVLFTGTPCQIGGLYSFLRKNYDNLVTQDLICHGVPSPMVWKKHVEEREQIAVSRTQRIFFRNKKYGWKMFSVIFEFVNNTTYIKRLNEDVFMRAFLSNSCLRPSCYSCSFKSVQRQADITLADFWGIQDIVPGMDDDKGTSLVLIHSPKGKLLFDAIYEQIAFNHVSCDEAIKYNSAAIKSCNHFTKREEFFRDVNKIGVSFAVRKNINNSRYVKLKESLKLVIRYFKSFYRKRKYLKR